MISRALILLFDKIYLRYIVTLYFAKQFGIFQKIRSFWQNQSCRPYKAKDQDNLYFISLKLVTQILTRVPTFHCDVIIIKIMITIIVMPPVTFVLHKINSLCKSD